MTEEIGSGQHREPSSATLDIAKMKERHAALKDNVADMGETMADIKALLIGHIQNSDNRHAQLLATFNQHNLEDAVVHQKVLQIDKHLEATDTRIEEYRSESKRDPVAFWTSVTAAAGAVGTIIYTVINGQPPSAK
jgi:hypothetical protein